MEIAFDEIMVGERGRAHDVLGSSLPDDIARSLAHHLDLPGQLPPGFQLENCVSGFPHAGRYVVARTTLDHSADRQGMVFSHALVADLGVIGELIDIAAVFALLIGVRPQEPFTSKTTVRTSECEVKARPSPVLCDMLATSSDHPVVIGDPLALEGIVSALWPRLLPAMRREIRFRLSFGPEESDIAKFHIVAVPPVTVSRWPAERVFDRKHGPEMPKTAAGRFLRGEFKGDLSAFVAELSIDCRTFDTLGLASRALEILKSEPLFEKTLAALRLIGSLQPDPIKGATLKASLLGQLANRPGPRSAQEFLSLRNLDLAPFPERCEFLGKMTELFNRLFETDAGLDALSPIAQSAFDPSQATEDWRKACCAALASLSAAGAVSVAPLVWMMLSKCPDVGRFLLERVASVDSMDHAMATCLGDVRQLNSSDLSDALVAVGFVQTETAVLINRHDGELTEALKEACERDRHRFGEGAVELIVGLMRPAALVTAAIAVDDQIVTSAAAAAIASAPTLMADLSLREPLVQKVWLEALRHGNGVWRIRSNVGTLRNEVFDSYLDGQLAPDLLDQVVSSPLGNALDYPRRADIWRALPDRCRDLCLAATAEAWTKSLPDKVSQADYLNVEHELAIVLGSQNMLSEMKAALEGLAFQDVLNVFKGNAQLSQALFTDTFQTFYQSKQHDSGEEINRAARLVVGRDWRKLTRSLLRRFGMTDDLRRFFHTCADHLDFWDRIQHGITRPSPSELHNFLVKTACELYPLGPIDANIWDRAGGNPSQLDASGTGQRQWEAAIRKIRKGNQVTAALLIAAMRDDYPMNIQLDYLAKEYLDDEF